MDHMISHHLEQLSKPICVLPKAAIFETVKVEPATTHDDLQALPVE